MRRFHNFLVALALASAQAAVADPIVSPKTQSAEEIPYGSLDEALKALRAKAGVTFREEGGWLVAYDSTEVVSWLLTPPGHPAYPSIVKRHIVNSEAGAKMATEIRCFAAKLVCDEYFGG